MRHNQSMQLKRIACIGGLILLTGGMIIGSALKGAANYVPLLDRGTVMVQEEPAERIARVEEPEDSRQVITVSFVGNCLVGSMLGSNAYGTFNEAIETEGADYFLAGALPVLGADDWTVAALGSVFSDNSYTPVEKEENERFWYQASSKGAEVLSSGSIDVVSLATDHTRDYGAEGYADTIAALEKAGVQWGDDENAVYLEKHGIRIGIYTCTLKDSETDLPRILDWVKNASRSCDITVVYPHGHMEKEADDEALLSVYGSMIDAGADMVLATHSTKMEAPVSYGSGVIVPSLGSFLSGDTRFPDLVTGVFQVKLLCTGDRVESWEWEVIPFLAYMEPWQPIPDPNGN
ncbi:MAG: CapA family protein [Clostridia bacterium]|nr:CapA family protein [Clostridia bacterium]